MAKKNLLQTMRAQFAQDESDEFLIRQDAREDLRFVAGKQWEEAVIKAREAAGRPALTFNRLHTFVQQVTNESRQNKPSIKFAPVDNAGDPDTAKVFEGLARHVQYASKAQVAYDTAIEYSAGCGFGYFRLLTEFAKGSFNLDVKFAPVIDPFSVYGVLIPKVFGRKPKHAFVVETISKDEHEALYPDSKLTSMGFAGDHGSWVTDGHVRVAEYWHTETKSRKLHLLEDGSIVEDGQVPDGAGIRRSRTELVEVVKFCKTNGFETYADSETTWIGDCIPVFAALGRQMIIDGVPELFSLVRHQRDPQRLINAYKSGIAERIGMVNRAPYVGYTGQFTDEKWRNANTVNYPYLEAEPVMENGVVLPLPTRQNMESQIGDLSMATAQEIDDLKATAGIFDASIGQQSNETSGIAIARRQQQSSITNLHFIGNLNRAQEEAGQALAYILPRAYDTAREVRIVGEDEAERVVRVNETYLDPESGEQKTYMLDADKYDVKVNIGPAYTTKRQEASEQYGQIIQAAPDLINVIGDIYLRNSDFAGNDEAAERLKKFIQLTQPGLIEDEKQKAAQIPPQVQAQIAQSGQMIEQLTAVLEETNKELETLKSKERIELEKIASAERMKMAELDQRDGTTQLENHLRVIEQQIAADRAEREAERQQAQFERQQSLTEQQAAQQQQQQLPEAA